MEEDLNWNVDLVLANYFCNIRRNGVRDHVEYDEFAWNDLKDLSEDLRNRMISGAHPHVFCPASRFGFWYNTLALKMSEEQAIARKGSEESWLESKERKIVEI